MADKKQLNTVIILRNDSTTDWATSERVLESGEVGVGYLDNGNVIVKAGNGTDKWKDLPQVEGVFEEDITLTHNFGRHVTKNGYVNAGGVGMTTSQWIIDALSEILNPTINYPNATLTAGTVTTDTGDFEIGSKITKFAWSGSFSTGSYKDANNSGTYGTTNNSSSNATGLTASNVTWSISNTIDAQTGTTEDGTFNLVSDNYQQINSESSSTYAYLNGSATLDASGSYVPLNNVGSEYTAGKIAGFDKNGTTVKNFTNVAVKATGFRKPFWGIKTAGEAVAVDDNGVPQVTSAIVRALPNSAKATKGLPTTTSAAPFVVAAGSQQVFFFAKAGQYTSVEATDAAAMNAPVTFTKVANAVSVEGANNYEGTNYDMFFVDWKAGIDADKKLVLTWK